LPPAGVLRAPGWRKTYSAWPGRRRPPLSRADRPGRSKPQRARLDLSASAPLFGWRDDGDGMGPARPEVCAARAPPSSAVGGTSDSGRLIGSICTKVFPNPRPAHGPSPTGHPSPRDTDRRSHTRRATPVNPTRRWSLSATWLPLYVGTPVRSICGKTYEPAGWLTRVASVTGGTRDTSSLPRPATGKKVYYFGLVGHTGWGGGGPAASRVGVADEAGPEVPGLASPGGVADEPDRKSAKW